MSHKRPVSPPGSPELSLSRPFKGRAIDQASPLAIRPPHNSSSRLSPAQVLRRVRNCKLAAILGVNPGPFEGTPFEDRDKVRKALTECDADMNWEIWLFAAQEVCIRDKALADYIKKQSYEKVCVPEIDYDTFISVLEDPRKSRLGTLEQIPKWILCVQVDELTMLDKVFAESFASHQYYAHATRQVLEHVVVQTFGDHPDLYKRNTREKAHHLHESIKFAFKYPRAEWLPHADYHAEFFGTVDHDSEYGRDLIEHTCGYFGIYGDVAFTFAAAMRKYYYPVWEREQEMEGE